jgi:hypothetical protein
MLQIMGVENEIGGVGRARARRVDGSQTEGNVAGLIANVIRELVTPELETAVESSENSGEGLQHGLSRGDGKARSYWKAGQAKENECQLRKGFERQIDDFRKGSERQVNNGRQNRRLEIMYEDSSKMTARSVGLDRRKLSGINSMLKLSR